MSVSTVNTCPKCNVYLHKKNDIINYDEYNGYNFNYDECNLCGYRGNEIHAGNNTHFKIVDNYNVLFHALNNRRCVKQTTIAIIENHGGFWIGTNWCLNPQTECPRDKQNMKSGEGYILCKEICKQPAHAEIDACMRAGKDNTNNATLYLIGHTYVCDNCKDVMTEYGIKEVHIVNQNKIITL